MGSGTTDKVIGRVKEAAGALTVDKKLKNEGKVADSGYKAAGRRNLSVSDAARNTKRPFLRRA